MKKITLEYLGDDFFGTPTYKDKRGNILKDVSCDIGELNLHTVCGDFDGEPDQPISGIDRYMNAEIIILGRENEPSSEEKFNYQMLSRLKMDCDYYLGNGGYSENVLWAKNVEEQIAKMKKIHNSFSENKKPEWLTYEDILDYEKKMTQ